MRAITGLLLATFLTGAVPPLHAATSPTNATRTQAVNKTAMTNSLCTAIQPFYWEMGDVNGRLGYGSVGVLAPQSNTPMQIYSAGKWIYAAYVLKSRYDSSSDPLFKRVMLKAGDQQALEMTSGYNDQGQCVTQSTVAACQGTIGTLGTAGLFSYGPGHFEAHAAKAVADGGMGLGTYTSTQLGAEIVQKLGNLFALGYTAPQLAGGAVGTAGDYAIFLRKVVMSGPLMMTPVTNADGLTAPWLGFDPVCASTGCGALFSPTSDPSYSLTEDNWRYSLGHWIEPDGTYSSPGAAGFYPWITSDKSLYGILARMEALSNPASAKSIKCGRLLRTAWRTNAAQ